MDEDTATVGYQRTLRYDLRRIDGVWRIEGSRTLPTRSDPNDTLATMDWD